MKNDQTLQIILAAAILILIFLISWRWMGNRIDDEAPRLTIVPPQTSQMMTLPPITEEIVTTQNITTTEENIPPLTVVPSDTKEETNNPNSIEYKNSSYGYSLSMPKKMYYAGFGPRDGALHTLAIQPDMLPESFNNAPVRVYYYGKKVLPELKNASNNRYEDPNGKYILLLLDGKYSVRIESDNLQSATVKAIEETIKIN